MAKKLAALGVALVLMALLAGLKFTKKDIRVRAISMDFAEAVERALQPDTARRVHRRAAAAHQAPGLNVFADLSIEEFSRDYACRLTTGGQRNLAAPPVKRRGDTGLPLPLSIDWRDKTCKGQPCLGKVPGQLFAATGALESNYAITGRKNNRDLLELSEIIDCDSLSDGCQGGHPSDAFYYVSAEGLASSAAYPYKATNGICQAATTNSIILFSQ
ncbi:hypothetical protein BS78_07G039300 [Paspalum vaginatum]|nr:hypothetical protein BS78_07G039300 [Paspalum vaginatum]